MMQDGQWIFHNQFQAFVHYVQYDWHEGYGQIWARGPVDMSGSIRFFTFIDEGARLILAYLDGKPDICYRKREDGTWEAGDLRSCVKSVVSAASENANVDK